MAKAKAKVKTSVKRKPVKAGSKNQSHGGLPTKKVVLITSKIKRGKK